MKYLARHLEAAVAKAARSFPAALVREPRLTCHHPACAGAHVAGVHRRRAWLTMPPAPRTDASASQRHSMPRCGFGVESDLFPVRRIAGPPAADSRDGDFRPLPGPIHHPTLFRTDSSGTRIEAAVGVLDNQLEFNRRHGGDEVLVQRAAEAAACRGDAARGPRGAARRQRSGSETGSRRPSAGTSNVVAPRHFVSASPSASTE